MKTALDVMIIITWVTAYLAVVYGVGHYRRTRAIMLGLMCPHEYRAEKDPGLRLVVFLAGTLLGVVAYLAARAFG